MKIPPTACPLCEHNRIDFYFADTRSFWQCENCQLVFVATSEHLSEFYEKERYDFHENDSNDLGYRAFLNRLIKPLAKRLNSGSDGLDFGCGPGPTVSIMLEELGHRVACFDKFYANSPELLEQNYDFITSTEVVEHLSEPRLELERLISLLKPAGCLGIMTKLLPPADRFATWHYKEDLTHICFYAESTFEWIADKWDLSLEILDVDVIILRSGS